jgi:hypothetical protein
MSRLVLSLLLVPLLACGGESAQKVTSTVVGKGVEIAKGAGSGVTEGIENGRKDARSADGSRTLTSAEEVAAAIDLAVYEVKPAGERVEVVVAVTNKTPDAVHLLGLHDNGGAQVIDDEGFATPLAADAPGQLAGEIQVPPNAKVKVSLLFTGKADKVKSVRLWGRDVPVSAPTP